MKKTDLLPQYWYDLPDELISRTPAEPRDSARLMIYDTTTDTVTFDVFKNIAQYLPAESLMVMNNTRVAPARVYFRKSTGGKVEGLLLLDQGVRPDGTILTIVRHAHFETGSDITLGDYHFTVQGQDGQHFILKLMFDVSLLPAIIEQYGTTPTPYYIGKVEMSEHDLRDRYQTIYARGSERSSVAAPTASLHFTDAVFKSLDLKDIHRVEVALHVGLGTFGQVTPEHIQTKRLHREYFDISVGTIAAIQSAKKDKRGVIAVGTTVARTLESSARGATESTDLFILSPFEFKIVDHLITNFHVPQSSLMALVDAFLQHKKAKRGIVELYQVAIQNRLKFYSFGDSMLIL